MAQLLLSNGKWQLASSELIAVINYFTVMNCDSAKLGRVVRVGSFNNTTSGKSRGSLFGLPPCSEGECDQRVYNS